MGGMKEVSDGRRERGREGGRKERNNSDNQEFS